MRPKTRSIKWILCLVSLCAVSALSACSGPVGGPPPPGGGSAAQSSQWDSLVWDRGRWG